MKKKVAAAVLAVAVTAASLTFAGISAVPEISSTDAARAITSEGLVLLKNKNNALPLKNGAKIALFGEGQADRYQQGSGIDSLTYQAGFVAFGAGSSRALGKNGTVAPLNAFRQAQSAGEVSIYEPLSQKYKTEELTVTKDTNDANRIARFDLNYTPDDAMIDSAAGFADTAIVFISRWGGECRDFSKGQWYLTDSEKALLKSASAKFDKVIVILNTSNAIDTSWAFENSDGIDVDAVLFAGYPGVQGGLAIADIILGKTNPSGKLTFTFAKDINDYPTTESFLKQPEQEYTEDIFLGYRYFETFNKEVNFPFGFGLSYTQFKTEKESFSVEGDTVTVKVKVTNIGSVTGKEVVQVYFSAPQGVLGKAAKELCAFKKTRALAPGGSEVLTLTFNKNDMASFDDLGKTGNKSAYVLEAGDYKILAGNSVKNVSEAGVVTVNELTVVEQLSSQCPTNLTKRLLADGSFEDPHTEKEPEKQEYILPAKGSVRVEAEDAVEIGSTDSRGKPGTEPIQNGYLYNPATGEYESGYSGSALASTWYSGSYAIYKVNAEEAGEYFVSVRLATDKSSTIGIYTSADKTNWSAKTVLQLVDTKTESGGKSNWYNLKDIYANSKITLNAGVNYIKLGDMSSTANPNIDSFLLEYAHVSRAINGTITVDAADYYDISDENGYTKIAKLSGATLYNSETGAYEAFSGNTLESLWPAGSFGIYMVNADETGEYSLQMRIGGASSNSSLDVLTSVDGVTFTKANVSFSVSTGSWTKYMDVDATGTVYLTAGINYIKVAKGSAAAPNMARFVLTLQQETEKVKLDNCRIKVDIGDYFEIGDNDPTYNVNIEANKEGYIYNADTGEWDSLEVNNLANMWCADAYAIYKVDVDKAGTYRMILRVARNREDNEVFPYEINVSQDNSTYTQAFTIAKPPKTYLGDVYSGPNLNYSYIDVTGDTYLVSLKKGTNYIKFTKGGSINLCAFGLNLVSENNDPEFSGYKLIDVINGTVSMEDFVNQMTNGELATFFVSYSGKGAGAAGASDAVCQKYGFARFNMSDGPAGLSGGETAFPSETILACTWNVDMIEAYASIIGAEAQAMGVDMWLAPGMNLHRNPLGGRDNEYFSEDPYISGVMGTKIVETVQSYGVGVCVKHFICNEKESPKLNSDSRVSERALRELYLEPFRMTVTSAQPWGVMSSYNLINGTAASENYDLLNNILREEWGYEGYVCGDWNNDKDIVKEINGGLTVRDPYGSCDLSVILTAVSAGRISRSTLLKGAKAMLNTIIHMQSYAKTIACDSHNFVGGVCSVCHLADSSKVTSLKKDVGKLLVGSVTVQQNLDIASTLDMNYYAVLGYTPENPPVMNIIRGGKNAAKLEGEKQNDGTYKFTYADIAPQSMADEITAQLTLDGEILAENTESIKSYCKKVYDSTDNAKIKTFMADMLVYGQALSDYKNLGKRIVESSDSWINDNKTDFNTVKAMLVSKKNSGTHSSDGYISSAGLYFFDTNKIYFRTVNNGGFTVKMTRNGEEIVPEVSGAKYYTNGIFATGFDDEFVLTVSDGETELHKVTYSVNSYVLSKCEGEKTINALARALGCYGYSAKELKK